MEHFESSASSGHSDSSFSSTTSDSSDNPIPPTGIEFVPRLESVQCNNPPKEAMKVIELRYLDGTPTVVTNYGHYVIHSVSRSRWDELKLRCACGMKTTNFEIAAHHSKTCRKLLTVCTTHMYTEEFFRGPAIDLDRLNTDPPQYTKEQDTEHWNAQFGFGVNVSAQPKWDVPQVLRTLASLALVGFGVQKLVTATDWFEAAKAIGALGLGLSTSDLLSLIPVLMVKVTPTWYAQGPSIKPWIPTMVCMLFAYVIAGVNGPSQLCEGKFWSTPNWRTFATTGSVMGPMLKGLFLATWEHLTGIPWDSDMDLMETDAELTEIYNEVKLIESGEVYTHINSSIQACDRILNLEQAMQNYKRVHTRRSSNDKICVLADDLDRKIREWVKAVHGSGKARGRFRVPPLVVRLHGQSNCGKSSLTPLLAGRILSGKIALPEGSTFSSQIYTRSTGTEFWGSYNHQPCVVYDDFGQKVDTASNPCPDFLELISAANAAPWNVPMADVESKARTFFRSSLVMLSSNAKNPAIKSVNCPEAVMRRIDVDVRVARVRPISAEAEANGLIDVNCCDYYVSPLALGAVGCVRLPERLMSWDELVDLCRAAYDRKQNVHTKQADQIEEAFKGPEKANAQSLDWMTAIVDGFKATGADMANKLVEMYTSVSDRLKRMAAPPPSFITIECSREALDAILELQNEGELDVLRGPYSVFPMTPQGEVIDRYYLVVTFPQDSIPTEFLADQTEFLLALLQGRFPEALESEMSLRSYTRERSIIGRIFGGFSNWFSGIDPGMALGIGLWLTIIIGSIILAGKFEDDAQALEDERIRRLFKEATGEEWTGESHIPRPDGTVKISAQRGFAQKATAQGSCDVVACESAPGWKKSVYPIYSEGKRAGYFVVVKGRLAIVPTHIINHFRARPKVTLDTVYRDQPVRLKLSDLIYYTADQDLTVFQLPQSFHHHRDLTKMFISMGDLTFTQGTVRLVKSEEEHHGFFEIYKRTASYTDYSLGQDVTLSNVVRYAIPTVNGDCGALVTHNVPSVPAKFLGYHVAGVKDRGLGRILFREELEEIISKFYQPEEVKAQSLANELDPRFEVLKDDMKPVNMPTKSKLRESILHGVFPATQGRSILRATGGVDPLIKGVNKYAEAKIIDPKEWENSRQLVAMHLQTPGNARVLTDEEALGRYENLEPVSLSKSAGLPWVHMAPKSTKDQWVKDGLPHPLLREELRAMEKAAQTTERRLHVYLDCLKDEKRALEKCDPKQPEKIKTRVFAIAPFEIVLLTRKYCGAFISHTIDGRIENTLTAGIDPLSLDWAKCRIHLIEAGENMFDGDWSGYDTRLPASLIYEVFWHIEEWYKEFDPNWTEQDAAVRTYLAREIAESRHQVGTKLLQWAGGLPSGCPGTNQIDSIANLIIFIRAMQEKKLSDETIKNETRLLFHGDDNLLAVSDRVATRFTPKDVMTYGEKIGMVFTAANKKDDINGYKRLEECQFLKRGFRQDGMFTWAPIDIEVPRTSIQWTKANDADTTSFPLALKSALEEWVVIDTDEARSDLAKVVKLARQKGEQPLVPRLEDLKSRYTNSLTVGTPEDRLTTTFL